MENTMSNVKIFDTTLRDGEQSPGVSLNAKEKITIARQLEKLGVDIIEAGFAVSSPGDFEAVKLIAESVENVTVASLARAVEKDIFQAAEALRNAKHPRIHVFLATSPVHMQHKLKKTPQEVLAASVKAVEYARQFTDDIEFSAEDAFRSEMPFLKEVVEAVIAAGATTVNLPDTVGYATPWEYGQFIREIKESVPNIDQALISVHCHNDLGMAVANSLAAVMNGAQQVEVTVNGIGERAGNAALEELVMAFHTRKAFLQKETNIVTTEIARTSRLISKLTGMALQTNKAVVGKNAFLHESGIHQDGVLKERSTYEIMNPEMIGITDSNLFLGKHSGRHAFQVHLQGLGYELDGEALDSAFAGFKKLCDQKKEILDEDLIVLVDDQMLKDNEVYKFDHIQVFSGTNWNATATVGVIVDGQMKEVAAIAQGPIDACYAAIDQLVGNDFHLEDYQISSVTPGQDAIADVVVRINYEGKTFTGRGNSTNTIEASAKAYLNAINKALTLSK